MMRYEAEDKIWIGAAVKRSVLVPKVLLVNTEQWMQWFSGSWGSGGRYRRCLVLVLLVGSILRSCLTFCHMHY